MKQLSILSILSLSLAVCSCGGNNAAKESNTNNVAVSSDAATSSSGADASFSCKLDGKDLSGKGTDQIVNAATVHSPGIIYFTLSPGFSGNISDDLRAGGIGFEVPDKGTTVIRGVENPDYSIGYTSVNTKENYECKEMTVSITSSGTSRLTGTFSGTLIEPKTDRDVTVTDGKFDIPYASYSNK